MGWPLASVVVKAAISSQHRSGGGHSVQLELGTLTLDP
jgi:hypothetical protein